MMISPYSGQCVWYDKCGADPDYPPSDTQHYLMCKYDGPAKSASHHQLQILQEVCPHLLPEVSNKQHTGSLKITTLIQTPQSWFYSLDVELAKINIYFKILSQTLTQLLS